jgi:hypothetical protein
MNEYCCSVRISTSNSDEEGEVCTHRKTPCEEERCDERKRKDALALAQDGTGGDGAGGNSSSSHCVVELLQVVDERKVECRGRGRGREAAGGKSTETGAGLGVAGESAEP